MRPALTGRMSVLLTGTMLLSGGARAAELCGNWYTVASPSPSVVNRVLHITGRSANDLWLLGSAGSTYPGVPMIWRWQGDSWTTIPLPNTSALGSLPRFNAITQLPNGDVLVGGDVRTSYPIDNRPFVARWSGSEWAEVMGITLRAQTVYPYGARGGLIDDLYAVGPDDIWAVGSAASMGSGGNVAMAVHFDGATWTEAETPIIGNRTNQLIAIDGSGSSDIWAVGVRRDIAGAYLPFAMHWDGESWTHHAAPTGIIGSFDAVAVVSPADAWALGAAALVHWDGSSWQSMPLPQGASSAAIKALAADDIWVAHMTGGYFHWSGLTWSFAPSPATPPAGQFAQVREFAAFGPCDVWAAGSVLALDGSEPSTSILEHLVASATSGDANCDGGVDFFDIDPFLLALFDPAMYAAGYCDGHLASADCNDDGVVNFFDIDPFLARLFPG